MTILISGGSGYVGSVLCKDLLNLGYRVICLDTLVKGDGDSLLPLISNQNFEFINMSINSQNIKKVLSRVDCIIHLAGLVGAPKCKKDPVLSHTINVLGTKNIISNLSGQRLIFASTGSVYGALSEICTEDSPLNPQSEYGIHKKIAEDMVTNYENSLAFRFATGCGVSPCMRTNLLVNNLVYEAVHHGAISLFQAEAKRTFISVQDMSKAFMYAINHQGDYKVYNCGDNSMNASKRDIAELIKQKVKCEVFYGDYFIDPDQRDYEVDYSRLNNSLGFKCCYNIEKVIDELIPAVQLLNIEGRYA